MLMGAARNALWAFNARVSLTCLYVVARKLPRLLCGLVWVAHSWEVMAHRPYGSIQNRMYLSALYCTGGLPPGFLFQRAWSFIAGPSGQGKGVKLAPTVLGRQYLEARHDAVDQLRFKPEPHIFIDIQVCIPVFVLQRPGGKSPDVILIVSDHGGKGILVAGHGWQDHRHRDRFHLSGHSNAGNEVIGCIDNDWGML